MALHLAQVAERVERFIAGIGLGRWWRSYRLWRVISAPSRFPCPSQSTSTHQNPSISWPYLLFPGRSPDCRAGVLDQEPQQREGLQAQS